MQDYERTLHKVTVRTVSQKDAFLFIPFGMKKEEINRLCDIDYGNEIIFISLYKNILRGMMTIKKHEKESVIQQELFTKNNELIDLTQCLFLDAVIDYTTNEKYTLSKNGVWIRR